MLKKLAIVKRCQEAKPTPLKTGVLFFFKTREKNQAPCLTFPMQTNCWLNKG